MKNKFLLIALFCLITLSLTSCSSKKDTTSYQTPLGEVAYLADVDYKIDSANDKITLKLNTSIDGKNISVEVGKYLDDTSKKEFVALKSSEVKSIQKSENAKEYEFELNTVANLKKCVGTEFYDLTDDEKDALNNSGNQLYVVLHLGTKLDEEKGLAAKDYRKCEITIEDCSGFTIKADTAVDSRYANTLSFDEAKKVITLNQLTGLSAVCAQGFGWVLYQIVHVICSDIYWLGLFIFTILVRSIGWPIYAKSNSTSQGMSKIQPEMERINKKYEGKNDQNSKMKQQMEIKELMKKNKVSMWGCLLPFLQMPIFIVVYEMVRKFPCTPTYDSLNYQFLWANLGAVQGVPEGDWVLAILVGVTMVATQLLTLYFQKRSQKKRENFYTRQNQASQKQANMTMIIMTVVMTVMMVVFAWDAAGMAFYWIIGNIYQLGQTLISKLIQSRKEDKEDLESGRVRGRN